MSESPFRLPGKPTTIQPGDHLIINKKDDSFCIVRGSQTLRFIDPEHGEITRLPCRNANSILGITCIVDILRVISGLSLVPLEKGEVIASYIFQRPERKDAP